MSDTEQLTFETAVQELEQIVGQLESGQLTLEASLALYERGQFLAQWCGQQLDTAVLRVEQLTADGELVEL